MALAPVVEKWLEEVWSRKASDLLLLSDEPARVRVDGELSELDATPVGSDTIEKIIEGLLGKDQLEVFRIRGDADFAFSWHDKARVRGNAYHQAGTPALALRIIPARVPSVEEIGLPAHFVETVCSSVQGFVLVTGRTGSGKSTTLAAIIDRINETRACHIVTLEDPIEYVHRGKRAAVSQREIGRDSESFPRALRAALREDPDVVLLGEMRDLESVEIALTLAETGHLVFATLHTNDAAQAIDRIVDAVPDSVQAQVRTQLASALTAVVAQRLLPKRGGGRVAAFEIMTATTGVRNLVREHKTNQLPRLIDQGGSEGMISFNRFFAQRVKEGVLDRDDALRESTQPDQLERLLKEIL